MNNRNLETNDALQRLHKVLSTGRRFTRRDIRERTGIEAVNSAVAELRACGVDVDCRPQWNSVRKATDYYYRMVGA